MLYSTEIVPTTRYITQLLFKPLRAGLTSMAERDELDEWLAEDPTIVADSQDIEAGLERFLQQNAVPPPPNISSAIWQRIGDTEIQKHEPQQQRYYAPPTPNPARSGYVDVEVSDTHIRVHKNWRAAFIAIFILAKIFLIASVYYYFKADSQAQEINRLNSAVQQTAPAGRLP